MKVLVLWEVCLYLFSFHVIRHSFILYLDVLLLLNLLKNMQLVNFTNKINKKNI